MAQTKIEAVLIFKHASLLVVPAGDVKDYVADGWKVLLVYSEEVQL